MQKIKKSKSAISALAIIVAIIIAFTFTIQVNAATQSVSSTTKSGKTEAVINAGMIKHTIKRGSTLKIERSDAISSIKVIKNSNKNIVPVKIYGKYGTKIQFFGKARGVATIQLKVKTRSGVKRPTYRIKVIN